MEFNHLLFIRLVIFRIQLPELALFSTLLTTFYGVIYEKKTVYFEISIIFPLKIARI